MTKEKKIEEVVKIKDGGEHLIEPGWLGQEVKFGKERIVKKK